MHDFSCLLRPHKSMISQTGIGSWHMMREYGHLYNSRQHNQFQAKCVVVLFERLFRACFWRVRNTDELKHAKPSTEYLSVSECSPRYKINFKISSPYFRNHHPEHRKLSPLFVKRVQVLLLARSVLANTFTFILLCRHQAPRELKSLRCRPSR